MARKQHLSRLAAPSTWPIKRKGLKWVVKPSTGPHSLNYSMPLVIYLRDILKIAKTAAEANKILVKGLVRINNKVRKQENFPVGIFDVIEIPATKKQWRVLLNRKGRLSLCEIPENEAKLLPVKIISKATLRKGKIQLNFSNGQNLLNGKEYAVSDVLLLDIEKNTVAKHIPLKEGNVVYVTGGKHTGNVAKLKKIKETGVLRKEKIATLEAEKETWQSPVNQLFAIGIEKPEIKVQ